MRRSTVRWVAIALALGATASLNAVGLLGWLENHSWDLRSRLIATQAAADHPIRLITIDRETLSWAAEDPAARLGVHVDAQGIASVDTERLHRALLATLLDACDAPSVMLFADRLFDPARGDDVLARALARPDRPRVVLPASARHEDQLTGDGSWRHWPETPLRISSIVDFSPPLSAVRARLMPPTPVLLTQADALGHVGSYPESERARRLPPFLRFDDLDLPALGLAAALSPGAEPPPLAARASSILVDTPPRHRIPLDHQGQVVPRYRGKLTDASHRYRTVSAVDLFTAPSLACARLAGGARGPELFVFLGHATLLVDTPVGAMTPMEVQATLLDNLLHDDFVRVVPPIWSWIVTTTTAVLIAFVPRRRPWTAVTVLAPAGVAWLAATLGWWWPLAAPTLTASLVWGARFSSPRSATGATSLDASIFDVFLSYTGKNRDTVVPLAEALRARGLHVWVDIWQLVPGRSRHDAVEDVIGDVRAAAVLVGRDGLGPWEAVAMRTCLLQLVERGAPVIPVLLPGAPHEPDLPLFLRTLTWVDLRAGFADEQVDRLVRGIVGERRPSGDRSSALTTSATPPG